MRPRRPEAHVNHERWLISYADFVTLLFAFFVVLFASSQADKKKQQAVAASIQSAFHPMGMVDLRADVAAAGAMPAESSPGQLANDSSIRQHLRAAAGKEIASGLIALHESPEGLVISLQEAGFFESGAAEVRLSAVPVMQRIAAALPETGVRVEGHTDDIPIHTPQFTSNWELSSGRASSIARLLLTSSKVPPERMSVAGYAEFHPVASNATEEGRAKNRRVDIVVLNPK